MPFQCAGAYKCLVDALYSIDKNTRFNTIIVDITWKIYITSIVVIYCYNYLYTLKFDKIN